MSPDSKVDKIWELLNDGGIGLLRMFKDSSEADSYSREAAIIDFIGSS